MKIAFCPALCALLALAAGHVAPARAADDGAFFKGVVGEWTGPGEIIAGKYKGTRFVCTFTGTNPNGSVGMVMAGGCRVGVFTQKMTASVTRQGGAYRGKFQDGAAGKGLDIVSGDVDGQKLLLGLNRNQLKGAMLAKLPDDNTMTVTVSVNVDRKLVPVLGVNLKRVDGASVGSISAE